MPQLASAVSDGGVRRGTVINAGADDADAPAEESFLLRVGDVIGFIELFGAALRRDGSTRSSSNPKASGRAGAPRVGSRRTPSGKAVAAAAFVVAVLPVPAGKVVALERRGWRRPPAAARARVFASEAVRAAEPVSPKVSCFGAVRSGRRAPAPDKRVDEEEERSGCMRCASVTATVRGMLCWDSEYPPVGEPEASGSSSTASTPDVAVLSPPRLGDVKRLASRRWPETMAAA